MTTIKKLNLILKRKTIWSIRFRDRGIAIVFLVRRTMYKNITEEPVYYSSFPAAVDAEFKRLTESK